jgi:hypothetical protein
MTIQARGVSQRIVQTWGASSRRITLFNDAKGGVKEYIHGNREKEHMHRDMGSDCHMERNDHRGSMRKSMSVPMPSMLPSMPKGKIVEILVFIDVNP